MKKKKIFKINILTRIYVLWQGVRKNYDMQKMFARYVEHFYTKNKRHIHDLKVIAIKEISLNFYSKKSILVICIIIIYNHEDD